jgi:type I restriction enzyme, S subunit
LSDAKKKIPNGWSIARIEDLLLPNGLFIDGDWIETKDQDPEGDVRLIQLADVGDGVYLDRSVRFLTSKKAEELQCTLLEKGDVLIARMPDPLGRACIFPGDIKSTVTVVDVCIVRTGLGQDNHRWLMWTVNAPAFRNEVAALQSGSTRGRISRRNLATISFPLPSLTEQRRIVVEIDKQFARLDEAVDALKRVSNDLKQYRAAVLKAACEGRLVETEAELASREGRAYESASELLQRILTERRAKWEADQLAKMKAQGKESQDDKWKAKYIEPQEPQTSNLPKLPNGWVWATIDAISIAIVDCPHSTPDWTENGYICVRTTEFRPGYLDLSDVRYVSESTYFKRIERLEPRAGDILYSREGGILGIACMVPPNVKLCLGQRMMLFRMNENILSSHVMYVLNSSHTLLKVRSLITGSASPHLNVGEARLFAIPLPPLAEQKRIVEEVEKRLRVVDELEELVATNLESAEDLRRAILKRAFEGRLVPQDPNDEPASVLLERIAAERQQRKDEAMKEKSPKKPRRTAKKEEATTPPLFAEAQPSPTTLLPVFKLYDELSTDDLFTLADYIFDEEDREVEAFYAALTAGLEAKQLEYSRTVDKFLVRRRAQ